MVQRESYSVASFFFLQPLSDRAAELDFLDLCDDAILHIFDYCPHHTRLILAKTCSRLHALYLQHIRKCDWCGCRSHRILVPAIYNVPHPSLFFHPDIVAQFTLQFEYFLCSPSCLCQFFASAATAEQEAYSAFLQAQDYLRYSFSNNNKSEEDWNDFFIHSMIQFMETHVTRRHRRKRYFSKVFRYSLSQELEDFFDDHVQNRVAIHARDFNPMPLNWIGHRR